MKVNQKKLVKKLCQKKYCQDLVKKAEKELTHLNRLINCYDQGQAEDVYLTISPAYQNHVEPIEEPYEIFLQKWQNISYSTKDFFEDAKIYLSQKNERMRSKSEVILANMLIKNSIPYLYEKPLFLDNVGNIYPDFTLLDRETRQEIYWEHMGMMDDPIYSDRATKKIQDYIKNGIFPGDRLIVTFESRKNPLDIKSIEKMILKRVA